MTTPADLLPDLMENLDDPAGTGFSAARQEWLFKEAIRFVVRKQSAYKYFPRTSNGTVSVVSGISSYDLTDAAFAEGGTDTLIRQLLSVEKVLSDSVQKGTIITESQRNDRILYWKEPVVYLKLDNTYHTLHLAAKPTESMTIKLFFAPTISFGMTLPIIDVELEYHDLIILRATIMGYGGEKNADNFWLAQYREALSEAVESWESRQGITEVQIVDGEYL